MSPPSSQTGESTTWNGHRTVDSVAPSGLRLLIASTSIDTPSTSESRMYSWRLSVHQCPTSVRKAMPCSHSCWVGSTSRINPCKCLTKLSMTDRNRSSGHLAKLSTTAAVAVSSLKSVAILVASLLFRVGTIRPASVNAACAGGVHQLTGGSMALFGVGDPRFGAGQPSRAVHAHYTDGRPHQF